MFQLPDDVVGSVRAASEAREHRNAAEIVEAVALLNASELYGVRQRDLREAFDEFADGASLEKWSGEEMGMPGVGEWFVMSVAPELGMTPGELTSHLLSLHALKYRLPCVWEAFCEGKIPLWRATQLEQFTSKLPYDAARLVNDDIAIMVRHQPWSRVRSQIEGFVKAADPELAREEALFRAERRHLSIGPLEHGHAEVHGLLSARDAIDLEHVVDEIASTLPAPELPVDRTGTTLTGERASAYRRDVRRSMALGELARASYGQDALPTHQLVVRIDADDPALDPDSQDSGAATIEDWGAVLTEDLGILLKDSQVVVRPIVDVRNLPSSDLHDPSPTLRFAVQQRNPVDVFPYGTLPSSKCDLDHTAPFEASGPSGQTCPANLGPLSRRAHRAKTFGGFHLEQPEPGVFHWTTPLGSVFRVTSWGTSKISDAPLHPPREPEPPPEWDDPPEASPDEPPPVERQVFPLLQHELFELTG